MARTFDTVDPDQYQDYLAECATMMLLFGSLFLTFDGPLVTVLDPETVRVVTLA
jgi:uncharacterized protein (DUF1330 family)